MRDEVQHHHNSAYKLFSRNGLDIIPRAKPKAHCVGGDHRLQTNDVPIQDLGKTPQALFNSK